MKYETVVVANYGNDSVALIQHLKEAQVNNVAVVSIETGWAAPHWSERVAQAEKWVASLGFTPIRLKAQAAFDELVKTRGNFPTTKFQWCAGFLKGLTLLAWLDTPEIDPEGESTIALPHRRSQSITQFDLPELLEESEHYNDRKVWYPLYQHSLAARNELVETSGLDFLSHRSLECDPCVNSDKNDWLRLDQTTVDRTTALERTMQQSLFDYPDNTSNLLQAVSLLKEKEITYQPIEKEDIFSMGCGSPYGCGM